MCMKKFFAILLAGAMLLPFAACQTEKEPPDEGTQIETPEGPAQPGGEKPEEKPEEKPAVYALSFGRSALYSVPGQTRELNAVLTKDGKPFDGEVEYAVADGAVASLAGNALTAIAVGKTSVTATYRPEGGDPVTAQAALHVLAETTAEQVNAFSEDSLRFYGRTYTTAKKLTFDNVCTGVDVAFYGTGLTLKVASSDEGKLRSFLDGDTEGVESVIRKKGTFTLFEGLEEGAHVVRILKASSPQYGKISLDAKEAFSTDGKFLIPPEKPELKLEFVGDSITAGCGSLGTPAMREQTVENSDATKAYAYLTAQALEADFSMIALEGICAKDGTVNAYNVYGQYSPNHNGKYDASKFDADVVVLALGENDMWHATSELFPNYNPDLFLKDYTDMLRLIREKHPLSKIVCIYGMMPASATPAAQKIITDAIAATGDTNITQIKMISNETGGCAHPSAEAHLKTAATLTEHLKTIL